MVTAMIYDTLKLAEQLEHEAGFDAARARAMARILAENTGGNLVTREDLLVTKGELGAAIQSLRSDLGGRIGELAGTIDGKISGLDGRVGGLEGKVSGLERKVDGLEGRVSGMRGDIRVLYWMSGTTLAGVATLLGIVISIALHVIHLE